jgi:tetratricopeptide (TPR) repeat protein
MPMRGKPAVVAHLGFTFHGFPWEPAAQDPDKSDLFEALLDELFQCVQQHASVEILDQFANRGQCSSQDFLLSSVQRLRFWFLLGRGYFFQGQWSQALEAFEQCDALLPPADLIAATHVYRSWALAAHEAHQFESATYFYERAIQNWRVLQEQGRTDCLEEDADSFLCNLYRLQADAWLMLGSCETARNLLEQHAQLLLERHFSSFRRPLTEPASTQNERNWRLLRLYVPWELSLVLRWQTRLASDPSSLVQNLYTATVLALDAARIGGLMPEGQNWTTSLYTAAAEAAIQRCRLVRYRVQQKAICQEAQRYIEKADRTSHPPEPTRQDQLHDLVLKLPRYELRYCELVTEDALNREDPAQRVTDVLNDVRELLQQALADTDPGAQLLAAQCAWLLGSFEAQRNLSSPSATAQALLYYQQSLTLIPSSQALATLYTRGLMADIARLT